MALFHLHWQYISSLYKKDNAIDAKSLTQLEVSMRLKKEKDYLDCDLIHLTCLGDYLNNEFHPVVAFTCDERNIIVDRIISYKSINAVYASKISSDMKSDIQFVFSKWRPGIVVFCNRDGSIKDYLDVNKLPPY